MSETIYTGPQPPAASVEPEQQTEDFARRWDKAMKRAFKGQVMGGRPTARATLLRSSEASDA
jgi:hypothetical protein